MIAAVTAFMAAAALGGALRFHVGRWLNPASGLAGWPAGTLTANVVASALLGLSSGYGVDSAIVGFGFAGSFSTWSTVAGELAAMLRKQRRRSALGYGVTTVTAGTGAAWGGLQLGQLSIFG